jgi:SAM-dependent methyltransferase
MRSAHIDTCEMCNKTELCNEYSAREMMLGLEDEFVYFECPNCGSLRIADIPADMSKYYPTTSYYSFDSRLTWRVSARRIALRVGAKSRPFLWLLHKGFNIQAVSLMYSFGFQPSMRILDVGSGSGSLIRDLRSAGFKYAMGIDPFVPSDLRDECGVVVKQGSLEDVEGVWDKIVLNHSLEHMPDQLGTLSNIKAKLAPDGKAIIRIPIVNWAWENYGTNWVQLDAPRHVFLHSERSFRLAAARVGLIIEKVQYDSWNIQFWGSELYGRNIALSKSDRCSHYFSRKQMKNFSQRAAEMNKKGRGDQAMFVLARGR